MFFFLLKYPLENIMERKDIFIENLLLTCQIRIVYNERKIDTK